MALRERLAAPTAKNIIIKLIVRYKRENFTVNLSTVFWCDFVVIAMWRPPACVWVPLVYNLEPRWNNLQWKKKKHEKRNSIHLMLSFVKNLIALNYAKRSNFTIWWVFVNVIEFRLPGIERIWDENKQIISHYSKRRLIQSRIQTQSHQRSTPPFSAFTICSLRFDAELRYSS